MLLNTIRRGILLLLTLVMFSLSGCTLRQLCGWATAATYDSPVERQEVDDRMDQHWGKE